MRVAAVIPCFNSKSSVLDVLAAIGPEISRIFVIDDKCPQGTGGCVQGATSDPRIVVLFHEQNMGVGGAVITGYQAALREGYDIVVKIDSDGQMNPSLVPSLIRPIVEGLADYVKGNRFHNPEDLKQMPRVRLLGNLGLSFLTKFSAGYWDIFDPTNGFTAIHASALRLIPLDKVSRRFFFETDMLFRLNIAGAVVVDMPMKARYGGEISNLSPAKSIFEFIVRHVGVFAKRVGYKYFLRDFNLGTLNLIVGGIALTFGLIYGSFSWIASASTGSPATAGTVMLAALPIIIGLQLVLGFWAQDYNSVPRIPLQKILDKDVI